MQELGTTILDAMWQRGTSLQQHRLTFTRSTSRVNPLLLEDSPHENGKEKEPAPLGRLGDFKVVDDGDPCKQGELSLIHI